VTDPRQALLDGAIDFVGTRGLTDLSLRELAGEIGTSHRMLIHHFGSKDGLWVAIVREVERRQVEVMATMAPTAPTSAGDALWSWWKHLSDPSLWPNERLFFEVYGQAVQGREPAKQLLDGIVDSWVEPAVAQSVALGIPRKDARAFARLGVAVTRGLLLDLLATEDRKGVDAAMKVFIRLLDDGPLRTA
jgi:AcrR family transcriptional regulator